ncbi:MAG: tRNA (guanine(10)-N(2))-dimethyltransferase, partial [Candidatus Korarchaeum sp.]
MSSKIALNLRLYREGKVSFYSTDLEELEKRGIPYTKAPVFYNPRMKLNRDLAVTVFSSLNLRSAADLMAASGVRALRLELEGGAKEVVACDSNCLSVQVMRINARLNK